ncbi:type I restriction enzyme HsdR N-terminal domain-containing protein [candidate division WOR-3 bacterium]|nr:type I restriction enzyme HsdR N-terminal domain-containing protein [candidate division WOR-3 bacterium]
MEIKEFKESLIDLSKKMNEIKNHLKSEEATKNALIMPLLQLLGYNIFNPQEVVPEYIADVGVKKGEKVDYAIFKDKKLSIIIECKAFGIDLNKNYYIDQLYRYFSVSEASIAILTNGEIYMFYTDIEEKNKMDQKPFMIFNMLNIQEILIPELKKLSKTDFDIDSIVVSATDLKLTKEIKNILKKELFSPTDEFSKYLITQIMPNRRKMPGLINMFSKNTKLAFGQLIKECVNNKLESMILSETKTDGGLQKDDDITSNNEDKVRKPIRKIKGFSFNGETYKVKTWTDMLHKLCCLITILHTDTFMRLLELKSHFSTNVDSLRRPKEIDGTDLYVDTNLSANGVEKLCKKIVELFEYDPDTFSIKELI